VRRSLLLCSLLALVAAPIFAAADTARLRVFASVLPIQTFVEAVGGDRVAAEVMVLPGQSPATYDPSPKQVAALAESDLYVRVGVPFEGAWMKRIQAANPDMPILDLRDGLPLREQEAHDHDAAHAHDHEHDRDAETMDPHLWTSPLLVRQMAIAIRDALSALDPEGAATYARNQERFDTELMALHQRLERNLAGLEHRSFMVYHPAWGYFADTYELEQIPIERAGKEPGPRRLSALIEQAKATGTHSIIVQPEFDQRTAQQLARMINGRVEPATPLAADYADNLERFAQILVDADDDARSGGARQAAPAQSAPAPRSTQSIDKR